MSKDQDHDHDTHGATTIRASKGGGGGGKLLLGAVAAAVILGGGYWAYKNYAQPTDGAQTAYNDSYNSESSYGDDSLRAGPVDPSDEPVADTASSDAAPPAASSSSSARSTPAPRRQLASTEEVPEVTIGVTPINATSEDAAFTESEDLVVTAAPRPIWDRTPTARRLSALYPERALERGREGEARLHCTVIEGGALDCARVSETPGGFGPAAVRVARTFRHSSTLANGADATGSPVNLRVMFRIDDNTRRG